MTDPSTPAGRKAAESLQRRLERIIPGPYGPDSIFDNLDAALQEARAEGRREAVREIEAQKYPDPGEYTGLCCTENNDDAHNHGYEIGWNTALDAVAGLNASEPPA